MKKICITYFMENKMESAETCITLPMEDFIADDLTEKGNDAAVMRPQGRMTAILKELAALQGYEFKEARAFEAVEP